jgi:hypothetical protein
MFSRIFAIEVVAVRGEQFDPAQRGEAPVHLDHAGDVAAVALSEVGVDLVVHRVELAAKLLDLLGAELGERALDPVFGGGGGGGGGGHWLLLSGRSR